MQPDASSIPIVSEEVKQLLINLKEIGKEYKLKMKEIAKNSNMIIVGDEINFGVQLVVPFKEFYRSSDRFSKMKKSMNTKRLEFIKPVNDIDIQIKGFSINENGDLVPMDSKITSTAIDPVDYEPMIIHN